MMKHIRDFIKVEYTADFCLDLSIVLIYLGVLMYCITPQPVDNLILGMGAVALSILWEIHHDLRDIKDKLHD